MAIDLVEGDTGSVIAGAVVRKNGEPMDLAGATVTLRWTIDGGAAVQRTATIVSEAAGTFTYQFTTGELVIVSGEKSSLRLNVVVTDAGGKVLTQLRPVTYTIRKKI